MKDVLNQQYRAWTIARIRSYDRAGYGQWVNGIYRECRMVLFAAQGFFYTCTDIFDAKTFVHFEWSETAFPVWDKPTLRGFCAAVGSNHFEHALLKERGARVVFALEGAPANRATGGRFAFAWRGNREIQFDLPEDKNGVILQIELWQAAHATLKSEAGRARLEMLLR